MRVEKDGFLQSQQRRQKRKGEEEVKCRTESIQEQERCCERSKEEKLQVLHQVAKVLRRKSMKTILLVRRGTLVREEGSERSANTSVDLEEFETFERVKLARKEEHCRIGTIRIVAEEDWVLSTRLRIRRYERCGTPEKVDNNERFVRSTIRERSNCSPLTILTKAIRVTPLREVKD